MILTTHALTGAVIGKTINSVPLIILLSIVIHYTMDSFRHAEYFDDRIATVKSTWWKIALDILTGLIIIFLYIYYAQPSFIIIRNILLGTFISMFPDLLTVLHWKFKKIPILPQIKKFHSWAHRYSKFPKYGSERQWNLRNARNDILISSAAITILFLF